MDWKTTLEEILAERRQQLGEPPSIDDFIALRAGELSGDRRRRLLEHASLDPEVGRELFDVLRFPEQSGDESPAADEDVLEGRWQALRERLVAAGDLPEDAPPPTVFPSAGPHVSGPAIPAVGAAPARWPLAAMFILGVAATLTVGRLRDPGIDSTAETRIAAPRINLAIVELLPVGDDPSAVRGGAEVVTVDASAGGLVLALAVPELAPDPGPFALELTRGDGTTSTVGGLSPGAGGVFMLDLPSGELAHGLYRLWLSDRDGRLVARFEVEVELARSEHLPGTQSLKGP